MSESVKQRIGALAPARDKIELRALMDAFLADNTAIRTKVAALVADATANLALANNRVTSSAGLTIASGKKTATCGNAFTYIAGGTAGYKAAGDCSALVGTCADAKACCWVFYIAANGTITTSAKTADVASVALALAAAQALAVPANLAVVGYLAIINSGAQFVGGSTDLDAGTVTETYYSIVGPDKALAALTATTPAALTVIE